MFVASLTILISLSNDDVMQDIAEKEHQRKQGDPAATLRLDCICKTECLVFKLRQDSTHNCFPKADSSFNLLLTTAESDSSLQKCLAFFLRGEIFPNRFNLNLEEGLGLTIPNPVGSAFYTIDKVAVHEQKGAKHLLPQKPCRTTGGIQKKIKRLVLKNNFEIGE